MNPIEQFDPEVWEAIAAERRRQQTGLEQTSRRQPRAGGWVSGGGVARG